MDNLQPLGVQSLLCTLFHAQHFCKKVFNLAVPLFSLSRSRPSPFLSFFSFFGLLFLFSSIIVHFRVQSTTYEHCRSCREPLLLVRTPRIRAPLSSCALLIVSRYRPCFALSLSLFFWHSEFISSRRVVLCSESYFSSLFWTLNIRVTFVRG